MAAYPGFEFQQNQSQIQAQIMSQKQLQSLQLLSYSAQDLRSEIYKALDENPALEILKDPLGSNEAGRKNNSFSNVRTTEKLSVSAKELSDKHQAALEAHVDERQSLQEYLLLQLHLLKLDPDEEKLGERIIGNLDEKGFHVYAPSSLVDKNLPSEKNDFILNDVLTKLQSLDPQGTCTKNFEESLFVQAKNNPDAPPLALFILNGHLNFIDPPQSARVIKKIKNYFNEIKNFPSSENTFLNSDFELTEKNTDEAIKFIKTLDPFPARNYGTQEAHYVRPDVYVIKLPPVEEEMELQDDFANGIVTDGKNCFKVKLANDLIPEIDLNPEFTALIEGSAVNTKLKDEDKKNISSSIKKARDFIEMISYRGNTILNACCNIVKKQFEFFEKGPGHLKPLRQKDIANELQIHETTVSRMANSKSIQCEWGLFEVKYFFTNVASTKAASMYQADESADENASREKVMFVIKQILEEHKNDEKKLSDQKVCNLLEEQGIFIARRTVAKYRSLLNIDSSYNR